MSDSNGFVQRDQWSGRSAFVLAAIGSAVGLGNLWGFPYKVYEGGGGAFLIPYAVALVTLGLPLLLVEFSIGHWSQQSPPNAFTRVARQYRFVGWWVVALAFVIVTYYCVVLSYCVLLLIDSVQGMFGAALPWAGNVDQANNYFFQTMLAHGDGLTISGLRWPIVGGLAVAWLLIYLSLFKGVKWVSKVVLITVPLPWLMLLLLTVRGLTLEGAVAGLKFYLEPDWAKLAHAATWRLAFGQVFFTLSLGFAVMLSYASFLHRRSDLNNNALIIVLSNTATSFIAGLAVFSTLGAMAVATAQPVAEVATDSVGLAFVTFPFALAKLPAGQAAFSAIFFIALLTLGVDSGFSIVEACLASVTDTKRWSRKWVLPGICAAGFFIGLLYCGTGGGLNWLGLIDGALFGPLGIFLGSLGYCVMVGHGKGGEFVGRMRDHANQRSDWRLFGWWVFIVRYVAPGLLIGLSVWSLSDTIVNKNWSVLIASAVLLLFPTAFWLISKPSRTEHPPEDAAGAKRVVGVLLATIVLGLLAGGLRLAIATAEAPSIASSTAQGKPAAAPASAAAELATGGYVLLAIVILVIGGGLIWCFYRALKAAGDSDEEIADEPR